LPKISRWPAQGGVNQEPGAEVTAATGHGIYPFFYGPIYPLFKAMAMVLDVTASMTDDGKMAAMQTAAKNLVYQLSALAKNDGDAHIPVVAFSKDVNTDSSNLSENWMDFSDWDTANGSCSKSTCTSKSSCLNMNAPAQGHQLPLRGCDRSSPRRSQHAELQIDARQKKLCDNAKGTPNDIAIYTMQVNTGSPPPRACCNIAQAAPTSSIW
jgi:hypothetical protein